MFPDTTNTVDPDSRGRDSNRISSKEAFDDSVVILDLEHMPHGCATWPAFWTNTRDGPWPTGGEIDIIEVTNPSLSSFSALTMRAAGRERGQTELDLVAFPSGVYHAKGETSNWVSLPFDVRPSGWLTELLVEQPSRRTVTPRSTTTKVVEPKFSLNLLMAKVSTSSEVDSMPSHAAGSMASRFGSGREETPIPRRTFDPTRRPSIQACGALPQPTSRQKETVRTRNISKRIGLSSI